MAQAEDVDLFRTDADPPVSDLAAVVQAPALYSPGGRERAGVPQARGDRRHATAEAGDADGSRATPSRSVAELAGGVGAPAFDTASVGERTAVETAGCDRLDARAEAEHVHRRQVIVSRSVSELA